MFKVNLSKFCKKYNKLKLFAPGPRRLWNHAPLEVEKLNVMHVTCRLTTSL